MWFEVGLILKKTLLYFPIASGRELSPETGDNTHAVPVSRSCRYGCVPLWELQHSLGLVLPYVNHLAPSRHRSSQSSWPVSSLRLTENGRSSAHCLSAQSLCVRLGHDLWIPPHNELWPDLGPTTFLSPPDPGGVTHLGLLQNVFPGPSPQGWPSAVMP